MTLKQQAIRGALWTGIQNWAGQMGAFLVFFVLARLLEPADFGLVALANVFLAFMQIFLEQGFAQALIQREDLEPEHLDTAFWTNIAIGIALGLLSLLTADWIAAGFDEPRLTPILRCFSLIFLINALRGTQQAVLERQFAFKAIAMRSLLGIMIGGITGIGMALSGLGVWSLVGQQFMNELVGTLVIWKASDWRPRFRFSLRHFRQLFRFGSHVLGLNFLNFFNTKINDFLIGYFLGSVALGYYAISYRILQVMTQLLVRTTSGVSLPTFSRLKHDLNRFRNAFYTVTRLTSAIAFPFFLGTSVLAPELVTVLFGEKWLPAVPVIQLLSILGLVRSISFFKSSVFMALGEPAWAMKLKFLSVTLNLVGFAIAFRWGIIGVTFANMMRGLIVFPVGQWVLSRMVKIPFFTYSRQFSAALVSSLVMMGLLLSVKTYLTSLIEMQIIILSLCTLLGAATYGLMLRTLAPQIVAEFWEIGRVALSRSKDTQKA
ncbi:Teichuronic acid biosynthesis protein TuaB [Acaryochloris thomasi RCC1774]|uniref:Teichuronic acid biosynthesis protein TuaB n=1 Tax=Acaryochloris thomasi RCC1774 TaxID=1764569 RepID=A0A2W1JSG2_9CYAN|nr:lipopolysaccharide biosynthesis protein [Acaryochloris thomasi]PZD74135.1 Teichuronic acid biosynthesis protein TuaB [Acaryochloris thomasi RCC1774]